MTPQRPVPLLVPALRHRWRPALALGALLGAGLALLLAALGTGGWAGSGSYLVALPPDGDDVSPVTSTTERAARDYGFLLGEDETALTAVAERIGVPAADVRRRAATRYEPGASVIQVRYAAPTPGEVDAFFTALDDVVGTEGLPTAGVPAGFVRPLRTDPDVAAVAGLPGVRPALGLPAGAVAGLLLAIGLERQRPRVVDRRHAQDLTGRPVLARSADDPDGFALDAVVVRLLDGGPAVPQSVAVLAPAPEDVDDAARLVDELRAATPLLVRDGVLHAAAADVSWAAVASVDDAGPDAGRAWLLLVAPGRPWRPVGRALERLADTPRVVVLVAGPARSAAPVRVPVQAGR